MEYSVSISVGEDFEACDDGNTDGRMPVQIAVKSRFVIQRLDLPGEEAMKSVMMVMKTKKMNVQLFVRHHSLSPLVQRHAEIGIKP